MNEVRTPIDAAYLADFDELSACGATAGGGVHREAGTAADHESRSWLSKWFRVHGFHEERDAAGNQFGLLKFVESDEYILAGSHLDSQPLGGRFDGAYGVLAAAHAALRVRAAFAASDFVPSCNLAVVNWFNEEGSRFSPSMMGSAVFTGKMPLGAALETKDRAGISVSEALDAGRNDHADSQLGLHTVANYVEIHIEQGRVLEDSQKNIGLVTSTWAAKKMQVTVRGEQSHTGSTVMRDRRDALYGAALIISGVRNLVNEFDEGALHTAVSEIHVLPNSPVTVAREVTINVDLRTAFPSLLAQASEHLATVVSQAELASSTAVDVVVTHEWGLQEYSHAGIEIARQCAEALNLSHQEIMTVAGHDSTNLKDCVPTVMLFVPSVEGISHNERELTHDHDALNGVALLTEVLARLVQSPLEATGSTRSEPSS